MQWNEFRSHIRHLSTVETDRIQQAFELAKKLHAGQKRQSGDPYFSHPLAVTHILADMHADADTLIAGLLHDTVEDTPITLHEIDTLFHGAVASLIDGLTKLLREDIGEKTTLDEQIETLRKIFTLMEQDVRIMVIKLVDRLHNMQTVEFLSPKNQEALARETSDIYVKIADRLCMQDLRDEMEALCMRVLHAKVFAELTGLRKEREQRGQQIIHKMQSRLSEGFASLGAQLVYEHPQWERLRLQRDTTGTAVTGLPAMIAIFICRDIDTCYQVLGALHQLWKREVMSFQDFINAPQVNGYRGLHTTIILEDGTRVRCKIRTNAMHDYARKGIATQCFSSAPQGLLTALPWTTRIAPLTKSTISRSQEFWESLKSDILGESIVIHGPADQAMQLPSGATALDGAFYLFGEDALLVTHIKLNGQPVDFRTPLKHADALDVILGKAFTGKREWLLWVKTNLATAKIRAALASTQTEEEKLLTGKAMLEKVMAEGKRGFIDEFREESLLPGLVLLGFSSLDDMYIALAEGHLEPQEAFRTLFKRAREMPSTVQHKSIRLSFPLANLDIISGLVRVYQRHQKAYRKLRVWYNPLSGVCTARMQIALPEKRMQFFLHELHAAGALDLQVDPEATSFLRFSLAIIILLILWGFDPVMARILLLQQEITPIDLTIVRFWSLTGLSSALLLRHRFRKGHLPEASLTLRSPSLWVSVLLLFFIALGSYFALRTTTPSQYTIPMTSAGLLLTSIVNRKRWFILGATWTLLIAGVALLVFFTPWPLEGVLLTLLAVASFSAFTIVSERHKRTEQVGARAAQYFFLLSILCAALTLPLLPLSMVGTLTPKTLLLMVGFSIVFAGLPYYIYYYLLSHKQIDFILRYSFIIIFTTGLGQVLFPQSGMLTGVTFLAGALVTFGAVMPLLKKLPFSLGK